MAAPVVQELLYGKYEDNHKIYQKFREKKEKQIKDFIEAHGATPLQRSDEWFLMRKKRYWRVRIGGTCWNEPIPKF